jgi:hypothetical protein
MGNNSENQQKILIREIRELTKEVRLSNSFWRKFLLALLTGLGTVIGATVLVAVLIFFLSQLASFDFLRPFVQDIVQIVQTTKK